jgi:hypothetical protein
MKEREGKIARGEDPGPLVVDEEDQEVGCLGFMKFLLYCALFILLASKFVTGDWLWEYNGKWSKIHSYLPVRISSSMARSKPLPAVVG